MLNLNIRKIMTYMSHSGKHLPSMFMGLISSKTLSLSLT